MFDPFRLLSIAWEAVGIIWFATALTSKRTVRRQSIASRLIHLCLLLLAAAFFLNLGSWQILNRWPIIPRSPISAYVGLVVTLAGLGLTLWARLALGRNWSGNVTLKQGHELVQSGPYRVVRHPIYTGLLVALLGTAIARGDIGSFVGLIIATVALRLKSLTEESFMTEQFGSRYSNYKREVKALIPYLW